MKNRRKRRPLLGIALIAIIISGLYLIYNHIDNTYKTYIDSGIEFNTNNGTISQLKDMVTGGPWTKAIDKMGNLESYYEQAHNINNNVAGWIFVDGTNINYPVMYNEKDEFYLTHNWKGESYWNGSIFLDERNQGFDSVSLINGHNMLNGIMFSQLMNFKNKSFFDGNHNIYIYDGIDKQYEEYKAIGAIYCQPNIDLNLGNVTPTERTAEVNRLMKQSIYGEQPYNGNNVILLNTCFSNGSGKHILVIAEQVPFSKS